MKRALVVFGAAALAACKSQGLPDEPRPDTTGARPIAGSARPSASGGAIASASASATAAAPEAPLAWGVRPPTAGALFPVVDGMCIHAAVLAIEDATFLAWGHGAGAFSRGTSTATFARFTDAGLELGEAVDKGLEPLWEGGTPRSMFGRWPDGAVLVFDQSTRMSTSANVVVHEGGEWRSLLSAGDSRGTSYDYRVAPYRGGALSLSLSYTDKLSVSSRSLALTKGGAPPPTVPLARVDFDSVGALAAFGGEVFVVGSGEAGPRVRWSEEGKVREAVATGIKEVAARFASSKGGLVLWDAGAALRFEKGAWTPTALGKRVREERTPIAELHVAPSGDLWAILQGGIVVVERRDGTVVDRLLPEPASDGSGRDRGAVYRAPGDVLAGVEVDDPWIVAKSGAVLHAKGEGFVKVEMPAPPFATAGATYKAETLVVAGAGDVYVNAGYGEKGAGWRTPERYRAILRTKRPSETLRCNEPSYGNNGGAGKGMSSFPPIADDACKAPFVVLLKDGLVQPVGKGDYPNLRSVVKGRADLGPTLELVEIDGLGRKLLGAAVPTTAAGKALAEAVGKKIDARPEVVCGRPSSPKRTVKVDVATGGVAP